MNPTLIDLIHARACIDAQTRSARARRPPTAFEHPASAGVRWSRLFVVLLGALAVAALAGGTARADAPYPAALPDFSRAANPPRPLFSPRGGTTPRTVLVLVTEFSDMTAPAGTEAAMATKAFGATSSARSWFQQQSFGQMAMSAASESLGAADGVMRVNVGTSTQYYRPSGITSTNAQELSDMRTRYQNTRSLQAADAAGLDFKQFDRDGDGGIGSDELVVVNAIVPTSFEGSAATRGMNPFNVDGKELNVPVVMVNTTGDVMTLIHEMAHVALQMRDLYGFAVGQLALAGPTIGHPSSFGASAYEKIHFGWARPTVVVRDGYYTIRPAVDNPDAFVLYDPSRIPVANDFLVVENRLARSGTSDAGPTGSGLVVWRASERDFESQIEAVRPLEIMRPDGRRMAGCTDNDVDGMSDEDGPDGVDNDGDGRRDEDPGGDRGCYTGNRGDLWNAPVARDLDNATWLDGSPARVGVRAIERRDPLTGNIRAYFDVRGAYGVLIDCLTTPERRTVIAGEASRVSFPVVNTGESSDSFRFPVSAPAGWTVSAPETLTLAPGARGTVSAWVTPPVSALDTPNAFSLRAQAQSITSASRPGSDCNAPLEVQRAPTILSLESATQRHWGTTAGFRTRLTDRSGTPVAGARVTFTLRDPSGRSVLSATAATDADGRAGADPVLPGPGFASAGTLRIESAPAGRYAAATASSSYRILSHASRLTWTGTTAGDISDRAVLSAVLTDVVTGQPIQSAGVVLTLQGEGGSAVTDTNGFAIAGRTIRDPAGRQSAVASYGGRAGFHDPISVTMPFLVSKEKLVRFDYIGDSVTSNTAPTLAVIAEQEDDGNPWPLTTARLSFTATGLLWGPTWSFRSAPVQADGTATSTAADPIGADVYTVGTEAAAVNPYWQGGDSDIAELVVFDADRQVDGYGEGGGTKPAFISISARYEGSTPTGDFKLGMEGSMFYAETLHWVVVNAGRAVVEATGTYAGQPAVARVQLTDGGWGGVDRFRAIVTTDDGTRNSGDVVLSSGDITLR